MVRRWITILCCLLIIIFVVELFDGQTGATVAVLRIDEKRSRLSFGDKGTTITVDVENLAPHAITAQAVFELIDPEDKVRACATTREEIPPGLNAITIPLIIVSGDALLTNELRFYRIRYRVARDDSSNDVNAGIFSVSATATELFALYAYGAEYVRSGSNYRINVLALDPRSGGPVRGVAIDGAVEMEPPVQTVKSTGKTDAEGRATLDFVLPERGFGNSAEVKLTGRLGSLADKITSNSALRFYNRAYVLVSSDKSLYQPGQTLHVRMLAFDVGRQVIANTDAELKISDADGDLVYRTTLKTSRYGIASADWPIPAKARLGAYRIEISLEGEQYVQNIGLLQVKVSRYELPAFTITTEPDQNYYLPGQQAKVVVRADYLFGQPVTRGRVRIVEEAEGWNESEKRWQIDEKVLSEGEIDASGKFLAQIDLTKAHAELAESDYRRFDDLTYLVYFTDLISHRTEQRRLQLRITKEEIHIYVNAHRNSYIEGLPASFYVTTFYADGRPARCQVTMSTEAAADAHIQQPRYTFKTNRFGLARVDNIVAPHADDRELKITLVARDRQGIVSRHREDLWLDSRSLIRVDTDKTLYRPGEPVYLSIKTHSLETEHLYVDLINEGRIIGSHKIVVKQGRGTLLLPYKNDMKGELQIAVYPGKPVNGSYYREDVGLRSVLYPHEQGLRLDVKLSSPTYRPGAQAKAGFQVRNANGQPAASALGVVVIDKAVEERARADRDYRDWTGFTNPYYYFSNDDALAGITGSDLSRLNTARPFPEALDLAAEIILNRSNYYAPLTFAESITTPDLSGLFANHINNQLVSVKEAIERLYDAKIEYTIEAGRIADIVKESGTDLNNILDPWGVAYRSNISFQGNRDHIDIISAGPDKEFGTEDDFTATGIAREYFQNVRRLLDRAVERYYQRTGRFIRDAATLRNELLVDGVDLDKVRDRWGNRLRSEFGIFSSCFTITIASAGPDGLFAHKQGDSFDDIRLWITFKDIFSAQRARLDSALNNYNRVIGCPQDERELERVLRQYSIDTKALVDPWGNQYYFTFQESERSVYVRLFLNFADARNKVPPRFGHLLLRSRGEDGIKDTGDDIEVYKFNCQQPENTNNYLSSLSGSGLPVFMSGAGGVLKGSITDESRAVISGAEVVAKHITLGSEFQTTTNEEGLFIFQNLPEGSYTVKVNAAGFKFAEITSVLVRWAQISEIDVVMQVGAESEVVEVTAGEVSLQTTSAANKDRKLSHLASRRFSNIQIATPRLRADFPETLLWQPEIETDNRGRAELKFKLTDNITTWKMAVIGSTEDGRVATAEQEFRAFQPFFIELAPPRVLTVGDEISLPVVVRNYLDKGQSVKLEMAPADWFTLLGSAKRSAKVSAGDVVREYFDMRVIASTDEGKQRVSATGAQVSDAIERSVSVHPDGEEITDTTSQLLGTSAVLGLKISDNVIKGSIRAELKVYPNLMAHALEGIEGILMRPYGCAEQTISSTYPNLLVLSYLNKSSEQKPEIRTHAERYLQAGYDRLAGYHTAGAGFSYWGRGPSDVALTAYALGFLNDAREFIRIDEEIVQDSLNWLIKQQHEDGSWQPYNWGRADATGQRAIVTAYIARIMTSLVRKSADITLFDSVKRALAYLSKEIENSNEPYLIASFALAALDLQLHNEYEKAIGKLRLTARSEGGISYWPLHSHTPFYGWGRTGRIEATALAVQALACSAKDSALADSGLLYILRNKDRYGVWHSAQATINVLDTLIFYQENHDTAPSGSGESAQLIINGQNAGTIALPAAAQLSGPITLDITGYISAGDNSVELRRAGGKQAAAQLVVSYYIPWPETAAGADSTGADQNALKLLVDYDRTDVKVGDEISCQVRAERNSSLSNGMLIAEIGLPPGADVDGAALERATKESGWAIDHYEIMPDRIVTYLWPGYGKSVSFAFKFKIRYPIKAKSASSLLYDYYNPEAKTTRPSVKFVVRQ